MSQKAFTRFLFVLSICLMPGLVVAQESLNLVDFSHQYGLEEEISVDHRVVGYEPELELLFKLTIRENRTRLADIRIDYAFFDSYDESLPAFADTLDLGQNWSGNAGTNHFFRFKIPNPDSRKFLVLRIVNKLTKSEFFFDIPIERDPQKLSSGLVVYNPNEDLPFFGSYLKDDETFRLKNFATSDSTLYIYRYSSQFPQADPPFAITEENIPDNLEIDSVFSIAVDNPIRVASPGLYFVQHDTSGVNGLTVRVEDKYFPKKTTYDELIETLRYFTTSSEQSKLDQSENKRTAFEEFWINATKSATRGRRLIREYYRNVSDANRLFTTYKQGWQTDQGMVYIIFGKPDDVLREKDREEWVYFRTQQMPRVSFTFMKVPSFFTDRHFVLIRKRSYQQIWYKAIDLWRKGQKGA